MRQLLAAFVLFGAVSGSAIAADKTAAELIKEIEAVKPPAFDRTKANNREAQQAYMGELRKVMGERAKLIGELYKVDPKNEKLVQLLPQRWQAMMQTGPAALAEISKEAAEIAKTSTDAKLKVEAAFFTAYSKLVASDDAAGALPAVQAFAKEFPKDMRAPQLLNMIANNLEDETKALEIRKLILKDFPDSSAARMVKSEMRQTEAVGKPFELSFKEATTGTEISMAALKGKVVVIDFWATWCGPCIAEMPKMKELYAKYKDQGVEFIGVSLDQPKDKGGLDKLLAYVKDNKIEWPQYYQGNYWQSEFSMGWGVNSIPCVFIVDADGKLYSVKARGKLDKLIPQLIEKRKNGKA